MPYKYINTKQVKEFCKSRGRRCGKDFLFILNSFIRYRLDKACDIKNGGKITLDGEVARYAGLKFERE